MSRIAPEPPAKWSAATRHAAALAISAAAILVRWAVDPLLGGALATLPAAAATVLAARWLGFAPACVALVTSLLTSEVLFARPHVGLWPGLARAGWSLGLSGAVGVAVAKSVADLRRQTMELAREVATRQEAELRLEASRALFEQFMDSAPVAAYIKDADGRFLFVNRHVRETYPAVQVGRQVSEMFSAEEAAALRRNDDRVRLAREPLQFDEEATTADGTVRHWSTFKFPVRDAADAMVAVGGVSLDVTENRKLHAQTLRNEAMLRRLIDVQEREKQSLCHEFHDGLIQYAIGAKMMVEAWRQRHAGADAAELDQVVASLEAGIADGRHTIRGIRPAVLDDLGLKAAVEEFAATLGVSGAEIDVAVEAAVDAAPATVQTTAFRIIQEAAANARRHSGTERLRIDARVRDGDLILDVQDFGNGFDAARPARQGLGIVGMAERARLAGGECHVDSRPGGGTTVRARLPMRPVAG